MQRSTMNTQEAAEYLGVHPNTIRKYVGEEHLPVLRFPGRRKWLFRRDLIDEWIEEKSKPQVYVNEVRHEEKEYPYEYTTQGKIRVLRP
ncbi:hypothetical protein Pryu01_03128 [Paraliobacillus ryukyuensis]|uniref:Excisionase family DNA binding protein n=1 Tax=Paraliobacillus ryukyuensis TaxID=200904 RepID=A0A366DM09_9BACI|nr:helix-turn-helix domain-containing protein [Paraliobacillus ryukyuensis]RBO91127.1 excisionase family DNA binding protein [Paraliobacillus ryukyuensis]